VYRLAAALDGAQDLVVVSNGLDTFQALVGKPGVVATLTGGSVEPRTGSLVGPVAIRSAADFLFDVFVCSAAAVDPTVGSSEASLEEAQVKRALSVTASRVVLAVDHSKLGTRAQARMFALDEISLVVTDLEPDDSRLNPYRAVVQVR
jgi:DeoR/GlpR family transcriptional regulator of sugar metabolism